MWKYYERFSSKCNKKFRRHPGLGCLISFVVFSFYLGCWLYWLLLKGVWFILITVSGLLLYVVQCLYCRLSHKPPPAPFTFKKHSRSKSHKVDVSTMSGEEFERYVANKLRDKGYDRVTLTPATADYGVDITATKNGVRYAFQCKRYSGSVGVSAVQEVFSGSQKYGADRAVVVTNSKYTPNANKLAKDLGVSLWELEILDAIF